VKLLASAIHGTAQRCVAASVRLEANCLNPPPRHIAAIAGVAIANENELWIDPVDYRAQLAEGVNILTSARVNVSVYNLQRCVLDRSVWPYAAQSISEASTGGSHSSWCRAFRATRRRPSTLRTSRT